MSVTDMTKKKDETTDYHVLSHILKEIKFLQDRVTKLEQNKPFKESAPKKPLIRVGSFQKYIEEVLSDGRVWSFHGIAEEIKERYPDLPAFTAGAIGTATSTLAKKGIITKIAHGNYRKK